MFDIFQSRENKAVLAALSAMKFGEHESIIADYRSKAAASVRRTPKRTALTLATTRNPSAVALLVLLEELGEDIASGNHHVYRGMLGAGGGFLTAAFAEIVRQLQECRAFSEEEAGHAMNNLREAIKLAG